MQNDLTKLINTAIEDSRNYPVSKYSDLSVDPDMEKDMLQVGYNPNSREKNDCLKNVTTWMRVTIDSKFNSKGLDTKSFFKEIKSNGAGAVGSREYKIITEPRTKDLQPGDIILGPGHVLLYTGDIEGKDGITYQVIEAAYGSNRVASFRTASEAVGWIQDALSSYIAIRLVG